MKVLFIIVSLFLAFIASEKRQVDTVTAAQITNDRLRAITVVEYPNANAPRLIDVRAVAAAKSATSKFIDASEFAFDTINQTTIFYAYFFEAVKLTSPSTAPSAAIAAAFAFAVRAFAIFEYLDLNGIPGFQDGSSDKIISAYDLSSPALQWNPITVSTLMVNGQNGQFKVYNVSATTADNVFTFTFLAAEQPVYVGPFRVSPDKVKIDFTINWYNPLHVPAPWTFGPSNATNYPNASVGILALAVGKFGVAGYTTNGNGGAANNSVSVGGNAFVGSFDWEPTATTTVQGVTIARNVYTHVVDTTGNALINAAWAGGWVLKIIFYSFEGTRPQRVFWDPMVGSSNNYAVVDQMAVTNAGTAIVYSALLLFATIFSLLL